MEEIIIYSVLTIFGLMFGSFAGATVWRLRARQLVEDKNEGEEYNPVEYKKLLPLTKSSVKTDRSRCLHCGHALAWYDLLPLVSWVSLRGKCRYCHKKIGSFEPLMEIGVAAFFVLSYLLWPIPLDDIFTVSTFILWLLSGVLLAILFVYDLKWFLLPDLIVYPFIAIAAIVAAIEVATAPSITMALVDVAGSVAILWGLHYVLHKVSQGRWMGFGDVKLGLGLGLLLADWRLAFIALFAANFIGCLVVIPGMIAKKLTPTSRVPFGPFLIMGMIVAMLWGSALLMTYLGSFGGPVL